MLDGGRKRVKFLPQNVKLLEELFLESQYPTTEVREKLEQQLGVPENRILVSSNIRKIICKSTKFNLTYFPSGVVPKSSR